MATRNVRPLEDVFTLEAYIDPDDYRRSVVQFADAVPKDAARERVGRMLWLSLICLNVAGRGGATADQLGQVLATVERGIDMAAVQAMNDILQRLRLANVAADAGGHNRTVITPLGISVAAYLSKAPAGISRPQY